MKKIALLLFVVGLTMIGIGSFSFFEKYDDYLKNKNGDITSSIEKYAGNYINENENIIVESSGEILNITINDEQYEFVYNKETKQFENEILGLQAKFDDNKLTILKPDEELIITYEQKK
jgi:hypothetical protein